MYRLSDAVRSTHSRDGAVVLDIRQGQMFNVNFVGSRILELLKGESSEPEIIDSIIHEFGVTRQSAENDVRKFCGALRKYQLVERAD